MSWFRVAAALSRNIASHHLSRASPLSRPDFFQNLVRRASTSPVNGHIKPKIDLLGLEDREILDPVFHGFSEADFSKADLDRGRITGFLSENRPTQTMRKILNKNQQWRQTFHSFTQPPQVITLIPGNLNRPRAPKKVFEQRSQPFSTEITRKIDLGEEDSTRHFDFGEEDLASEERLWCLFERWMRHYATPIDLDKNGKRFSAFKSNAIFVHESNRKGRPFELGLNQFADMTYEEFIRNYASRPHRNRRTMRMRGSSKRGICTIADGNAFPTFMDGGIMVPLQK